MTSLDVFESIYTDMAQEKSEQRRAMLHSLKGQLSKFVSYLNGCAYAKLVAGFEKHSIN